MKSGLWPDASTFGDSDTVGLAGAQRRVTAQRALAPGFSNGSAFLPEQQSQSGRRGHQRRFRLTLLLLGTEQGGLTLREESPLLF